MNSAGTAFHPVSYGVEPQLTERNRLTSAFRLILAIPHLLLVGGPGAIGVPTIAFNFSGKSVAGDYGGGASGGVLGVVAGVMSIISWFAIVLTGKQPRGLWDFTAFYFRWRSKSFAYVALLRDEYPPFGEGDYPVQFSPGEFPVERDRLSVFFRIFLLIPHAIILFFVGIAWFITAIIGWFAILFSGAYPEGLYNFAAGYLRWSLRFETYMLLMHDKFPPFSLE